MASPSDNFTLSATGVTPTPGWTQVIPVTNPGAGVLVATHTIPGQYWEMVLTARATFTADATAGTRTPQFQVVAPDGTVLYAANLSTGVALSTSITASLALDVAAILAATGETQNRLPKLILASGYVFRFAVNAVGPADAWSAVTFLMAQWPTNITSQTFTTALQTGQ